MSLSPLSRINSKEEKATPPRKCSFYYTAKSATLLWLEQLGCEKKCHDGPFPHRFVIYLTQFEVLPFWQAFEKQPNDCYFLMY